MPDSIRPETLPPDEDTTADRPRHPGTSSFLATARAAGIAVFFRHEDEARGFPHGYGFALAMVAATTLAGLLARGVLTAGSIILLFLIAVLLIAMARGLGPSLMAAVLSVLAYDFLFLPPLYSLDVENPDDAIRIASFALAAVIVSNLAAHARRQTILAGQRALVAESLYRFGRQLAAAASLPDMLAISIPGLRDIMGAEVMIFLPTGDGLAMHRGDPGGPPLEPDLPVLETWFRRDQMAPPGPASSHWRFVPMRTGHGGAGLLAIARARPEAPLPGQTEALFGTVADLLAQTIDRISLVEAVNDSRRAVEREALQAALMASLSHDLRTPLAAVLGAAENLMAGVADDGTRETLVRSIQEEALRLNRHIGNLLDMTRLEYGIADAAKGRIDLTDVVNAALERCADSMSGHVVAVNFEPDLPMPSGDEVLLEHVLFNLLDNAAKYTPRGASIRVRAFRDGPAVSVQIADSGPGIEASDLPRIFEKFYRSPRDRGRRAGIGLGLAICRGYVEAMGGTITAGNRTDEPGAVFTVTLPVPAAGELSDHSA